MTTGTAKTRTALNTEIETTWFDNAVGAITPAVGRQTLEDIVASSAFLLETATFTPSTVEPAVVVNGPNDLLGTAAAVTINKGTNGVSAFDIVSADNAGSTLRLFGPLDISPLGPAQYFNTGGFFTKLSVLVSGTSIGANIQFPSTDPCMIAVWADVNKGVEIRASTLDAFTGDAASIIILNSTGKYVGSILWDGTIAWGSSANATFAGQDTFLGRGGVATLQLGGPDGGPAGAALVAQTLGVANVPAPFTAGQGFLYTKVLKFAANPTTSVGQSVTSSPPSIFGPTLVTSVDLINHTVTVDRYMVPYAGDTILFNGINGATLLTSLTDRIGYGSLPAGVVVGQTVTDVTTPSAIPGGTTVTSIAADLLSGSTLVQLSAQPNGALMNQPSGNVDTLQYASPNTAAADFNIVGGIGTGTGAGGKVLIKGAPAGSTGSTQNSEVTFVTVDPSAATGTPEVQVAKGLKAGFYATAAPTTQTGSTYSVGATDTDIIANASGTLTLTMPAVASFVGRELYVKTIAAHTVVSNASNVAPIDSATPGTAILAGTAGKWARLKSDGSNWVIMAGN